MILTEKRNKKQSPISPVKETQNIQWNEHFITKTTLLFAQSTGNGVTVVPQVVLDYQSFIWFQKKLLERLVEQESIENY